MYEVFSDRARQAVRGADDLAKVWGHDRVGPEHILCSLLSDTSSRASELLRRLDVDPLAVRAEIRKSIHVPHESTSPSTTGWLRRLFPRRLPHTADAKRAIEHALAETRLLDRHIIGSELLLIGVLRDPATDAARLLANAGITADWIRELISGLPECEV